MCVYIYIFLRMQQVNASAGIFQGTCRVQSAMETKYMENSSLGWYVWETYLEMGWEPMMGSRMFPWNVRRSPDFPASLKYLFGFSWHDHHDPTEVWGYVSWLGSGLYPIKVLFFCRLNVRVMWNIFLCTFNMSSHILPLYTELFSKANLGHQAMAFYHQAENFPTKTKCTR